MYIKLNTAMKLSEGCVWGVWLMKHVYVVNGNNATGTKHDTNTITYSINQSLFNHSLPLLDLGPELLQVADLGFQGVDR